MKKQIFYISLIDWFFTKQRPQHIAEQLSRYFKVKYICNMGWKTSYNSEHTKGDNIHTPNIVINENLTIRRIRVLPGGRISLIKKINDIYIQYYFKKVLKINQYDIIWLTHPFQWDLIPSNYPGEIIYDYMDNYIEFLNNDRIRHLFYEAEKKVIRNTRLQIASSKKLFIKLIRQGAKCPFLLQNAADFEHFNKANYRLDIPYDIDNYKKIIGYFGGIGNWFDIDLVINLAQIYHDVDFIIIGPLTDKTIVKKSSHIPNIKLLGQRPYELLPNYLSRFHVCLLPFKINNITNYVNPIKLYEYLSAGKPVVAIYSDETKAFHKYVYLARNYESFVQKITLALKENNPVLVKERIKFASENTWDHRGLILKEILKR